MADGDASSAFTILLVRHAAHARVDQILCGRMADVRLGTTGMAQAKLLAGSLAHEPLAALYSSPLERCRETAAALGQATGRTVSIDERITEIDFGRWTGARFDALASDPLWRLWNERRGEAAAPDGERMAEVQVRALAAIDAWRRLHAGRTVAAVTHGDVIRAVVCATLGLSLDRILTFTIDPASVTALSIWEGGGQVLYLNRTVAPPMPALSEAAA